MPGLAVVLVGEDPASQVYVGSKTKQADAAGLRHFDHRLPASTSTAQLISLVQELNSRRDVHGILVQLPLPQAVDSAAVLAAIDPAKDVDGFHAVNAGRLALGQEATVPCTPLGCLILIRHVLPQMAGKRALVIGRSNIVGKPMAQLLLQNDCTVTIAHSRTRDLPGLCAESEILVAAIGRPKAVAGEWIRPGAVVIDVGINRVDDGSGKTQTGRRCRLRGCARASGRNHAGPRRRRSDDDRVPTAQHSQRCDPRSRRRRRAVEPVLSRRRP